MSLLDDIRNAQIRAGEDAVIRDLERMGLASSTADTARHGTDKPEPDPASPAAYRPVMDPARVRELQAADLEQARALLRQAMEALEYHTAQTRPISHTADVIAAISAYLPGGTE